MKARRSWLLVILPAALIAACAKGSVGDGAGDDTNGDGDAGLGDGALRDGESFGEGGSCSAPKSVCETDAGNACVDTTSDPNHCGTCTLSCETADAGVLEAGRDDNPDADVPYVDAGDGGSAPPWSLGAPSCATSECGVTCPASLTLCSDHICYDTDRFHEHCGNCATACSADQYCASGHCCAPGTEYCGAACTDVLSNVNDCGSCGHVCGAGMQCIAGACEACTTNEALTATPTSSGGGTTTYGPAAVNDGVLETTNCNVYDWETASNAPGTAYLQYTWPAAKTLTKMHMDTLNASVADSCGASGRTMGAAQIQWWNGAAWITDGTVSAKLDDWDYTFTAPVTTTQVRLYALYATNTSGQTSNPVCFEWQVTGCN